MYYANEIVPQSFRQHGRSTKAPSAMNKQPVFFTYTEGKVVARVNGNSMFNALDLGIALLHFKLGSKSENNWYFDIDHYKLNL